MKNNNLIVKVVLVVVVIFLVGNAVSLALGGSNVYTMLYEYFTSSNEDEKQNINNNADNNLNEDASDIARKEAYKSALNEMYFNYTLPDGTKLDNEGVETSEYYDVTQNQFAIYDIDFDGREELIISLTHHPMASMRAIIYDYDNNKNELKEQFTEFPTLTFYNNSIIEAGWSHNQGLAGGALWPYTLYKYNEELDSYEQIARVDAWDSTFSDTNFEEISFPTELDEDSDGILYYIMNDGEYSLDTLVDFEGYNEWRTSYIENEDMQIDVPYMNLTEENINNIK